MGTCCDKGTYTDINMEHTMEGDLNNLVISIDAPELEKDKEKLVKNGRMSLKGRLEKQMNSIGKTISIEEFNKLLPEEIKNQFVNPFEEEYPKESLDELVKNEPIEMSNGDYYNGYFNNSLQMEGPGELIQPNSKTYITGLFKDGKLYKGKIILPIGEYVGETDGLVFHGKGTLTYKDKTVYEGDFVEGVKEGNGSLIYPDGTKYWGDITKGEIEGEGEFIWNNGYYYKGGIKNGIFNGKGVLKAPNGSRYNGDFLNGVYHGKGKFLWGDPSYNPKDPNSFQESYVGEYSHGKKEGKGQYQLKNGDIFEGEFFGDKPHGRGELETNDSIYRALWKNGQIAEQPQIEKKEDIDTTVSNTEHNLNFVVRKEDIDITQCKYINLTQLGKL